VSAPEEYVVRVRPTDGAGDPSVGTGIYDSDSVEDEARRLRRGGYWDVTVHKLGPALEPPEPREWVVAMRETNGLVTTVLHTREEAEGIAKRHGATALRVVPEDAP